jgi:hypothetical protein
MTALRASGGGRPRDRAQAAREPGAAAVSAARGR